MADALLTVENLTKSFGDKLLFEDISFGINAGQKSALIARNGYGKSTLLNIIMTAAEGERRANSFAFPSRSSAGGATAAGQKGYNTLQDAGKITFRGDLKLAYLPQSPEAYPKQLVRDFVYNVQRPETEDEWTFEQRMEEILSRMRVDTLLDRQMETLSGGEQKKVALCRLLMDDCNLLILDEPTNHLDMMSKDVLKEAIKAFDGTVIVVSHDREFLEGLVDKVYEFGGGTVREHLGGIYDYLRTKNAQTINEAINKDSPLTPLSKRVEPNEPKVNKKHKDKGNTSPPRKRESRRESKRQKQLEEKIEKLETRKAELDNLLMLPENGANMQMVNEYTDLQAELEKLEEEYFNNI